MADQAIHWLFPTPVLQVDLTPTAAVSLAMEQQLALFDREVFSHPEFSDRNNLTGDLLGKAGLDQLHRLDAFQWLNQQLAVHVDAFLGNCSGPITPWRFISESVACGSVPGRARSAPYAPQCAAQCCVLCANGADNPSGELEFQAPDDYFSHVMAIPYRDARCFGGCFCQNSTGAAVPSDLRHQVTPYEEFPRYSVSYDLAVTTAPGQGPEMRMPHPMDWVPLQARAGLRESPVSGSP